MTGSQPLLTTIDNPFDPFTDFSNWWSYDAEYLHHNPSGVLARNAHFSDLMTPFEEILEYERAIDLIIANDPENIYTKVYPKTH